MDVRKVIAATNVNVQRVPWYTLEYSIAIIDHFRLPKEICDLLPFIQQYLGFGLLVMEIYDFRCL